MCIVELFIIHKQLAKFNVKYVINIHRHLFLKILHSITLFNVNLVVYAASFAIFAPNVVNNRR